MDLKLKSLKSQLESCNDKLEVLDYVYDMYDTYLDEDIKHYINLKHTIIELNVNKLNEEIEEVYKELENFILERIEEIQKDIDRLNAKKKRMVVIAEKMLPYILHSYMLADPNSIYYTPDYKQLEKDKLDAEISEFMSNYNNRNGSSNNE
jgi:anion-transporting  ArsA/GET3 family ATPase